MLIAGWLIALPVPLMLAWAPSWGWIIAANILLGINQGLTWSTTVIMKIDLVGPETARPGHGLQRGRRLRRGRRHRHGHRSHRRPRGLRPEPFLLGAAYVVLALGLSTFAVRETRDHARFEAARTSPSAASTTGN